mgnify:CR=1 FL=1
MGRRLYRYGGDGTNTLYAMDDGGGGFIPVSPATLPEGAAASAAPLPGYDPPATVPAGFGSDLGGPSEADIVGSIGIASGQPSMEQRVMSALMAPAPPPDPSPEEAQYAKDTQEWQRSKAAAERAGVPWKAPQEPARPVTLTPEESERLRIEKLRAAVTSAGLDPSKFPELATKATATETVPAKPKEGPIVPAAPPNTGGSAGFLVGVPIGDLRTAVANIRGGEARIQGEIDAADIAGQAAIEERRKYDTDYAVSLAGKLHAQNEAVDAAAGARAAKVAAFNQYYDTEMGKLDRLSSEAASARTDFWQNKSTGDKVVAAIAMALGTAGARSGVENPALKVLDQAIEDEVNDKRAAVVGQKSYLAELRTKFDNEAQQDEAVRIAAISRAEMDLKEMAAGSGGQEAAVRAQEALAMLAAKRAAATESYTTPMVKEFNDLYTTEMQLSVQAQGFNAQNQPAAPYDWSQHGLQRIGQGPLEPEVAKKAIEGKAGAEEIRSALRKLLALRKDLGTLAMIGVDQSASAKAAPILADLQAGYTHWKTLGAYDKGTQALMEKMTTDKINDWGFVSDRLTSFMGQVDDGTKAKLRTYGFLELPSRVE